ncbi:serine/threonine protein kinase [Plasmodium inui San Antonio 1]|uniref:Serine/threonine protein kinase n=1 Tax=Plasmodium inui San Antonio 1 TaxID=1237626 RepID=W7A8U0_9APIC|nr:serine/threonine protein kinase [Plasmodium inui San Antonio 1]EUD68085.1 serine/threonine protein kinase [Plasmodium inui San Antonio 1]
MKDCSSTRKDSAVWGALNGGATGSTKSNIITTPIVGDKNDLTSGTRSEHGECISREEAQREEAQLGGANRGSEKCAEGMRDKGVPLQNDQHADGLSDKGVPPRSDQHADAENVHRTHIDTLRKLKSNPEINLKRGEEIVKSACVFVSDDLTLKRKIESPTEEFIKRLSMNAFHLYFPPYASCYNQISMALLYLSGDVGDILIGLKYLIENLDEVNFLVLSFIAKLKKKKKVKNNQVVLHLIEFLQNRLCEENLNYKYSREHMLDFYDNLMHSKRTFFESGLVKDAVDVKDLRLIYFYTHGVRMKRESSFLKEVLQPSSDSPADAENPSREGKVDTQVNREANIQVRGQLNRRNFVITDSGHELHFKCKKKKRKKKLVGEIPVPNVHLGLHSCFREKSIYDVGSCDLFLKKKTMCKYISKCVGRYMKGRNMCRNGDTHICSCLSSIIVSVFSDAKLREKVNIAKKEVKSVKNVLVKIRRIENLVERMIKYDPENVISTTEEILPQRGSQEAHKRNADGQRDRSQVKRKRSEVEAELPEEEPPQRTSGEVAISNCCDTRERTFSEIFSSENRKKKKRKKDKGKENDADRGGDQEHWDAEREEREGSDESEESDESIKTHYYENYDFNFVFLGSVKKGSDRHRSLLFKLLCDSVDIPCRFVRYVKNHRVKYFNLVLVSSLPGSAATKQNIPECIIPIFWEDKTKTKTSSSAQSKITVSNFTNNVKMTLGYIDRFFLKIWEGNNEVVNLDEYFIFEKKLGVGGFGEVWDVSLKEDREVQSSFFFPCIKDTTHFALKIMDMNEFNLNESVILREKAHTNVVKLYCTFKGYQLLLNRQHQEEKKECLCFLLQLADTSLEKVFCDKGAAYNLNFVRLTLLEIANVMSFIHKPNARQEFYIYRDLKPDNVLIKEKKILLTDFNLSRKVDEDFEYLMSQCCGTKGHLAPEQKSVAYNRTVDIWAFGVIVSKFLKHKNFHYFSHGGYKVDLKHFEVQDKFLINLLLSCIDENPFMRPTFGEISRMIINEIVRNELERYGRATLLKTTWEK